jgi:hypothetical protein
MTPAQIFAAVKRIERKLDAVIQGLAFKAEMDRHATEKRKVAKGHKREHQRDGEGGPPAEAGSGGEPQGSAPVGGQDTAEASGPV